MPKIQLNVKNRVLESTKKMIADTGNTDFTMRDIAKDCGIALGTIYNYYPSKAELIIDIVADLWDKCFAEMRLIDQADFFSAMKEFYGILQKYLQGFTESLMSGLGALNSNGKELSSSMDLRYVSVCKQMLVDFLVKYNSQLDCEILDVFGYEGTAEFMLNHFTGMVRNHQTDYSKFDYFIKKLLVKNSQKD